MTEVTLSVRRSAIKYKEKKTLGAHLEDSINYTCGRSGVPMRGKPYGCNYFAGEKLLIKLNKCTFYTIPSLALNVVFIFPILKYRRKTIGSKGFFSIFLYRNFCNVFQKVSKISWIYHRKKQFFPKRFLICFFFK